MGKQAMTNENYCGECTATSRGGCWPCKKHAAAACIPEIARLANAAAKIAMKHEVQYWLDEPGTDDEKLVRVLAIVREIIAKAEGR